MVVEAGSQKHVSRKKCNHHWVIDSPEGPVSTGICKFCGATKEFTNYLPYSSWDDDGSKFKNRIRSKRPLSKSETINS
jgi:hypothetical protein